MVPVIYQCSMTKKITVTVLLVASLLTMQFRCHRDDILTTDFQQAFEIPVDIYPLKKSYTLTDTVWIETDISAKLLFDKKTGLALPADTGMISFGASYNLFGTSITNPANGFCEVIVLNGGNPNRQLSQWATSGFIQEFGCGQSSYRCKMGFRPLLKGTYFLSLGKDLLMGSCPDKVVRYNASVSYRYKSADLGLEIFNALSDNDKGGKEGIAFHTSKIINREFFIFKVE